MNQTNHTDRYLTKELHDPNRCQFRDCPDDIIPSANGVDRYCFKHQIDPDI